MSGCQRGAFQDGGRDVRIQYTKTERVRRHLLAADARQHERWHPPIRWPWSAFLEGGGKRGLLLFSVSVLNRLACRTATHVVCWANLAAHKRYQLRPDEGSRRLLAEMRRLSGRHPPFGVLRIHRELGADGCAGLWPAQQFEPRCSRRYATIRPTNAVFRIRGRAWQSWRCDSAAEIWTGWRPSGRQTPRFVLGID